MLSVLSLSHLILIVVLHAPVSAAGSQTPSNISSTFAAARFTISCAAHPPIVQSRSSIDCLWSCFASSICASFCYLNGSCTNAAMPAYISDQSDTVWIKDSYKNTLGYIAGVGSRKFWVFQQRKTGAVLFNRIWDEYERGFGDGIDFWIGLRALNLLTMCYNSTLRIEATARINGILYFSEYSNFIVQDASTNYMADYNQYISGSSNFAAAMSSIKGGIKFSTFDRDNDNLGGSCSIQYHGYSGFWFKSCAFINPNGYYAAANVSGDPNNMASASIAPAGAWSALRDFRMMLQV